MINLLDLYLALEFDVACSPQLSNLRQVIVSQTSVPQWDWWNGTWFNSTVEAFSCGFVAPSQLPPLLTEDLVGSYRNNVMLQKVWRLTESFFASKYKAKEKWVTEQDDFGTSLYVPFIENLVNTSYVKRNEMRIHYPYFAGRAAWFVFHVMAQKIADCPGQSQQQLVSRFVQFFLGFASSGQSCPYCREHFISHVSRNDREALAAVASEGVNYYPLEWLLLGPDLNSKISKITNGSDLVLFIWKLHNAVTSSVENGCDCRLLESDDDLPFDCSRDPPRQPRQYRAWPFLARFEFDMDPVTWRSQRAAMRNVTTSINAFDTADLRLNLFHHPEKVVLDANLLAQLKKLDEFMLNALRQQYGWATGTCHAFAQPPVSNLTPDSLLPLSAFSCISAPSVDAPCSLQETDPPVFTLPPTTTLVANQSTKYVASWTVVLTVASPDGYPREVIGVYNTSALRSAFRNSTNEPAPDGYMYDEFDGIVLPGPPFPGPEVRVRQGDNVEITVTNSLFDTSISVHWHGLHMKHNAWMDGTHGITQCGIPPGGNYTYRFKVEQGPGTHWYHSHSGAQYGDGLQGVFIILPPVGSPELDAKDYSVVLQDWSHESYHTLSAKYTSRVGSYPGFLSDYPWPAVSILINGNGQFGCKWVSEEDCENVRKWGWVYLANGTRLPKKAPPRTNGQCNPSRPPYMGPCRSSSQQATVFQCVAGKSIRMRLINTGFSVPLRFWIDGHNLTIIAKDGEDVQPDGPHIAVLVGLGQRIDVRVSCDGNAATSYYVFAAVAYEFYPGAHVGNPNPVASYAILKYNGAEEGVRTPDHPPTMWPLPALMGSYGASKSYLPMHEYNLSNVEEMEVPAAVERIIINTTSNGHWWNYEFIQNISGKRFEWWNVSNHVPFHPPLEPALHLKWRDFDFNAPQGYGPAYGTVRAPYIQKLRYQKEDPLWYEIVLVNIEGQQHPWHLHGHTLHFLGFGWNDANATYRTKNYPANPSTFRDGKFQYEPRVHGLPELWEPVRGASRGDSFTVPPNGFVVFRIRADNPGPWMLHCHMEYHLEVGMAMMFSVEDANGAYDVPDPPADTPACNRLLQSPNFRLRQLNQAPSASADEGVVAWWFPPFGGGVVVGWITMVVFAALYRCYRLRTQSKIQIAEYHGLN